MGEKRGEEGSEVQVQWSPKRRGLTLVLILISLMFILILSVSLAVAAPPAPPAAAGQRQRPSDAWMGPDKTGSMKLAGTAGWLARIRWPSQPLLNLAALFKLLPSNCSLQTAHPLSCSPKSYSRAFELTRTAPNETTTCAPQRHRRRQTTRLSRNINQYNNISSQL